MAVTIKLKNASGSDPSASDLVLGELAVRTDNGKIFLKKDDGNVAEVSGGGIDDGDKGDITVSNSGATFTIDSDATQVANKLPLAGGTLTGNLNLSSSYIDFSGSISAPSTAAAIFRPADNTLAFSTANAERLRVTNDGATLTGRLKPAANDTYGLGSSDARWANFYAVTGNFSGNITASGTVDGRDLASDGSKLDGIESGATADQSASEILTLIKTVDGSGSGLDADLLDGSTGADYLNYNNFTNTPTIPSNNNQLTNGAGYITATLTNEQVQDIVGGMVTGNTESGITVTYQDGDGTLDFSVASQTDNNFTNSDHSKLDGIESGATADQTASEILTLIKTVDGAGSGLDADTLDGISSANFLRSNTADSMSAQLTLNQDNDNEKLVLAGTSDPYIRFQEGTTNKAWIQWNSAGYLELYNQETSESLKIVSGSSGLKFYEGGSDRTVWHAGNQGSGSGLDADKLDTLHASSFLRSDAADTAGSDITFGGGAGAATIGGGSDIRFTNGSWTGDVAGKIQQHDNRLYLQCGSNGFRFRHSDGTDRWEIDGDGNLIPSENVAHNIGSDSGKVDNLYVQDVYCSDWLRVASENHGLYNSATGQHWYSDSAKYWAMDNDGTNGGIIFRDSHGGTIRGYLYYNNSNQIGFLDSDGNWAVQVHTDTSVNFRVNNATELTVLPDTVRCEGAFFENAQAVAANKTISDGYNAMSAGPITINSSVTVTVGSGETWTIV